MAEMAQDYIERRRNPAAFESSDDGNDSPSAEAAAADSLAGDESAEEGEGRSRPRKKKNKKKKKKGLTVEVPHFHMKIDPRRATIKNQIIYKQYSTASLGSKRWIPENHDMYLTSYPFGLRSFDFADVPH